jgi:DNA-directed RNA polymerase specialized sigma24 family protein
MGIEIEDLYQEFDVFVKDLVRRRGCDVSTAKDVVQNVFLEIWFKKIDLNETNITANIRKLADLRYIDFVIENVGNSRLMSMGQEKIIGELLTRRTDLEELDALYILADTDGNLLRDAYENGLPLETLKERYNLSLSAVKMRLLRGKDKIRKRLKILQGITLYLKRYHREEYEKLFRD